MVNKKIEIEESSGNVFKDLGLPNSEELLIKADTTSEILNLIEKKKLSSAKVAELLKITKDKVSFLADGKFNRFSLDTLYRFKEILESSQNDKGEK